MRPPKIKRSYFDVAGLSENKKIFILGPISVLLAKIANTLILRRDDAHALGHLRAAVLVTSCFLRDLIEENKQSKASHIIQLLLYIADNRAMGRILFEGYSIDILDAIPRQLDGGLDDRFVRLTLTPEIKKIRKRRKFKN